MEGAHVPPLLLWLAPAEAAKEAGRRSDSWRQPDLDRSNQQAGGRGLAEESSNYVPGHTAQVSILTLPVDLRRPASSP